MYLSVIETYDLEKRTVTRNRDYHIAVVLSCYFATRINQLHHQFLNIFDLEHAKIKWPVETTRLIENGVFNEEYYEDKTVYSIPPCESHLDYYGYDICKEYYPTQYFWEDHIIPERAYLCWYNGSIGFELHTKTQKYEGYSTYIDEWNRRFNP